MYTIHGQSGEMMDLNSIQVIAYKVRFEFSELWIHKNAYAKYFESKESTTKNHNWLDYTQSPQLHNMNNQSGKWLIWTPSKYTHRNLDFNHALIKVHKFFMANYSESK
jgi:hypothetical protein